MATQLETWWRRANFPAMGKANLGFASEYWDSDPKHYEGWEQLRDRLKALGRKVRKRHLAYELASHLLGDVLVAAGGVELAGLRMLAATDVLQTYAEKHDLKASPGIPHGLGHPAAIDLWYAFADVVSWSRTLVERLERRPFDPKKFPKQGLIPALKPKRLKARCQTLLDQLRASPVGEARRIANFMLHTALVAHPFSGVAVDTSGRVCLPIPDAPNQPVGHWSLLTWNQKRDGLIVAERMWQTIQRFVDELLAAFEKATPKRMRR